ncbi:MAG: twin-arginine translocase TatA/TatE family subunit [Acidobacteriota bacterium]
MPNLGFPELLVLFVIVLIIFGGSRLPALGKGLGDGIRNFRRGMKGDDGPDDPQPKP